MARSLRPSDILKKAANTKEGAAPSRLNALTNAASSPSKLLESTALTKPSFSASRHAAASALMNGLTPNFSEKAALSWSGHGSANFGEGGFFCASTAFRIALSRVRNGTALAS